jgi:hypothetical protein
MDVQWQKMRTKRQPEMPVAVENDLRRIPGIGPSLARDLYDLGIRRVSDLRRRKPEAMYQKLCQLRESHQDRCVLYVFRCAVYFASEKQLDPERLKWWNWKDAKLISSRP